MNLTGFSLRHPYAVISAVLLVVTLGITAYFRTPVDLFPETAPPQVLVVTVQPGAAADDVADKITEPVEKELNTLGKLESIVSTSRDQVSSVRAEFKYTKELGEAVLDVQNAIGRIRADLPAAARQPQIYRITSATTHPLVTIALSPEKSSNKTFSQIRLLAENQIKDRLLRLKGIADVDVFGGHQPEVKVRIDRDKLAANNLTLENVVAALSEQNISAPAGTIYSGPSEYLVKTAGEFKHLDAIRDLPIRRNEHGLLRISDVATVELAQQDARSIYHGNGKAAIAVNIMRPPGGRTVEPINTFKKHLPSLRAEYPGINFEITDDQEPLINLNLSGMQNSIIGAIVLTVVVIFVFLADIRAALVVSISIPLAFLFTLIVLWLSPYNLNMVTLSGLIVAIGMVVDASVVALENIYRHYSQMDSPDTEEAARQGTNQIALAITAGMLTTVAVLVPIMFIGGHAQRTIGRLSFTIAVTLVAALVVALTVVPLVASRVLAGRRKRKNVFERAAAFVDKGIDGLKVFYLYVLSRALRWRVLTILLAAGFFILTMRTIPSIIGGEQMPPMDTGISIINFDAPATDSPQQVERLLDKVEKTIYQQEGVLQVSSVVGSEPGAISFGSGGATAQSVNIIVHLVARTKRDKTIWQIQDKWRQQLCEISGIKSFRISEFGATPMATTKAPLDIIISGPDRRILDRLAEECTSKLKGTPGLVDVRRSWYYDEIQQNIIVDPALAQVYGTSPDRISRQLKTAIDGVPATPMRLPYFLDIPIRLEYRNSDIGELQQLQNVYVNTKFGQVPLRSLADFKTYRKTPIITHEDLQATIDITGVNRIYTIKHVNQMVKKRISKIEPPAGYSIELGGTTADMKETQKRLAGALIIAIMLLYVLLLAMFGSFAHPLTIMSAIPLAVAGGYWGMLIFGKPMCTPARMGMIFLAGTVINNSVLLLDFILQARNRGLEKDAAIMESVSLRLRPILMTTFSTIVGLSPLVFEMAVGLERMSPVAVVASTGLLVGTIMTMVVVPVVYSSLESLIATCTRGLRYLTGTG